MAGRTVIKAVEDYEKLLKKGVGQGARDSYVPWIRVNDFTSSNGVRSSTWGIKTNRQHHTLSSIETEFLLIAEFMHNVTDIREQFPLLPLSRSLNIADVIGVISPKIAKNNVPVVMTTDFLLTLKSQSYSGRYLAVSVKPLSGLTKRAAEKLEIERIWWETIGVKFQIYTGSTITKIIAANIEWATTPFRDSILIPSSENLKIFLEHVEPGEYYLDELYRDIKELLGVTFEEASRLVKFAIFNKNIVIDIEYPTSENNKILIRGVKRTSGGYE